MIAIPPTLLEEWELTVDGAAVERSGAAYAPVRTASGLPATLKMGSPADAASQEHLALQRWGGRAAARLLRADPHRSAVLLERLTFQDLTHVDDVEACEIVARMYAALHVPALPQLPHLTEYAANQRRALSALPRSAPVPRRMIEQTLSLLTDFAADPGTLGTLIHGDLHFSTVVAASDDSWVAIDPQALNGDPHFELAPMLWHRFDELAGDIRVGVRRRFHRLVDTADLDEDRARDWVIVRAISSVTSQLLTRQQGPTNQAKLTAIIAISKAVQE